MEPSTQKLIHTFGALADLGQEIAGRGDFSEMVREMAAHIRRAAPADADVEQWNY